MKKMTNENTPVARSAAAKEERALKQMYEYFKANRDCMPENITTQRSFVIARLMAGQDIEETYAQAIAQANLLVEIKPLPKYFVIQVKRSANKAA